MSNCTVKYAVEILLCGSDLPYRLEKRLIERNNKNWSMCFWQMTSDGHFRIIFDTLEGGELERDSNLNNVAIAPWQLPMFSGLSKRLWKMDQIILVRPFDDYAYCLHIGDPIVVFDINNLSPHACLQGTIKSVRMVAIKDLTSQELNEWANVQEREISTPQKVLAHIQETYAVPFKITDIVSVIQMSVSPNGNMGAPIFSPGLDTTLQLQARNRKHTGQLCL